MTQKGMGCQEHLAYMIEIQSKELAIIRLSRDISNNRAGDGLKRNSDASTDAGEDRTPANLAADLVHYKELFSKLRFSYLEQITKEKFLRAITGDPPLIVEPHENLELERQLLVSKASLKEQKGKVAAMTAELEAAGRDLSQRYEQVQLQTLQLSALPHEIEQLEEKIAELRGRQGENAANPSLHLPLPATVDLLSQREMEADELDAALRILQCTLSKRSRELERLESELRPMEIQQRTAILTAKEAMRRKEQGERGMGDDLEMKGRWCQGVDSLLGDALDACA